MTHNKRFSSLLSSIKASYLAANSSEDLLKTTDLAENFTGKLSFDNTLIYFISGVAASIAAIYFYLFSNFSGFETLIVAAVATLISLFAIMFALKRQKRLSELSEKIFLKDAFLDNHLSPKTASQENLEDLQSRFNLFSDGNHSRELLDYKSHNNSKEESSLFDYFHFYWVDSRIETYVVSDGKGGVRTKTRTVYDRYNRYGLIFPFSFSQRLFITSAPYHKVSGKAFEPASNEFNRNFNAIGDDRLEISRFLNPLVVEKLNKAAGDSLCLEITKNGELCLSISTPILNSIQRTYGLENPIKFKEELKGHTQLPKLQNLAKLIKELDQLFTRE